MRHRKAGKLPTGEKIILLKVGGRTSAVVPSLQKKTGAVAGDVDEKPTKVKAQKPVKGKAAQKLGKATKKRKVKEESEDEDEDDDSEEEVTKPSKAPKIEGRRRSTRND
jgi:hypothetical protein